MRPENWASMIALGLSEGEKAACQLLIPISLLGSGQDRESRHTFCRWSIDNQVVILPLSILFKLYFIVLGRFESELEPAS